MSDKILKNFDSEVRLYERLTGKAIGLIEDLLAVNNIAFHSVTGRTKNRDSLERKLAKPDRTYTSLAQITDLSGVRVITYFERDVDLVTEMINKEFAVDHKNSGDKGEALDPDRFGYLSMHQVVTLRENRAGLKENAWVEGRLIEIQTRSILQHAWAEIEHDLGYKAKKEVPRHVRRKFSRLAGLLELADSEFNGIRNEVVIYNDAMATLIREDSKSVEVDLNSLISFVRNSEVLAWADKLITNCAHGDLICEDRNIGRYISGLSAIGLVTIGDVEDSLRKNGQSVATFAHRWLNESRCPTTDVRFCGISLLYLVYFALGMANDRERIRNFFIAMPVHGDEEIDRLSDQVLRIFKSLNA